MVENRGKEMGSSVVWISSIEVLNKVSLFWEIECNDHVEYYCSDANQCLVKGLLRLLETDFPYLYDQFEAGLVSNR